MTKLTIEENDFSVQEKDELQKWLTSKASALAIRHIKGGVVKHLVGAANDALGSDGRPNQIDSTNEQVAAARRYETFLEVFEELQQKLQFTKIKTDYE